MKRFVKALARALGTDDPQITLDDWQKKLDDAKVNQEGAMKRAQEIIVNAAAKGMTNREIAAVTGLSSATVNRILKESKVPVCLTNENPPA